MSERLDRSDGDDWCSDAELVGAALMGCLLIAWLALALYVAVTL